MLLDTSAVIEIFRSPARSKRYRAILHGIGEEEIFVSMLQLAEVADWAVKNRLPAEERLSAVKDFARIVPLDDEICLNAAEIKNRRRESGYKDFSLADAIILATARSIDQRLLTLDRDFAGERDCIILG